MQRLRDWNPYTTSINDPRSETLCGALIALILLPAISAAYTVWFAIDWINNERGSMFVSEQSPMNFTTGLRMDADDDALRSGLGQSLVCTAESGCWYTVVADASAPNMTLAQAADRTCPPRTLQTSGRDAQRGLDAALRHAHSSSATAASIAAAFGRLRASQDSPGFSLQCVRAEQGQPLRGSCLYHTPVPSEALAVTFHDVAARRGDSMGVALVSPSLRANQAKSTVAKLFGGERCAPHAPMPLLGSHLRPSHLTPRSSLYLASNPYSTPGTRWCYGRYPCTTAPSSSTSSRHPGESPP